ncbi:acetamidase [Nitriliruptoraceae bacterium ZYF776]|nr:acetamidase [Profundirhabdus halotolerans]
MRSIHHRDGHLGWDRTIPPIVRVASGEVVELTLADCFDGQLAVRATPGDVATLDATRANPLTGPIHVEGARPGDTLAVEVVELELGEVGWTAVIPGFGLLADDFPDPHVVVSHLVPGGPTGTVEVGTLARIPAAPFLGTVGLAPAAAGPHSVIPPRRVGGNLDGRLLTAGATLLLPVEVEGALLSVGDPHALQGDGEVCGTAVETTARARLRVEVLRDAPVRGPVLRIPPRTGPDPRDGAAVVTTGVGPDLEGGAREATRAMVEQLVASHEGLAPVDAYVLCSVLGDLAIAEVVDAPNWVVTLRVPLGPILLPQRRTR